MKHFCSFLIIVFFLFSLPFAAAQEDTSGDNADVNPGDTVQIPQEDQDTDEDQVPQEDQDTDGDQAPDEDQDTDGDQVPQEDQDTDEEQTPEEDQTPQVIQAPQVIQVPRRVQPPPPPVSTAEVPPSEPAEAEEAEDTDSEEGALLEPLPDTKKPMEFFARLGIALAIIIIQALLIWLIWQLFRKLSKKVVDSGGSRIKPLTIKKLKILSTQQIIDVILFSLKILKYLVSAIQLFLTVPIVFSLFPQTRSFAMTLFNYILTPLKNTGLGIIKSIPNLLTIVVIVIITRYVLKALRFFSVNIAKGRLVIPGFYADWAEPTYKIIQVLLWAFTVAIAYPYLPGSDSRVFQGVSVFVGIIFSLGSSSAIGNLVAGLVITYMRPFKIGDRVKINDSTGFVVEKTLMVVRLKTHKNEYVTFPNTLILSSGIINYHTSSDEDEEGLVLNTEVTVGYATPWQTVHEILIKAALETDKVLKSPKPFVLQTGLDDFYARYQINCYTKEVDTVPRIYTELYKNIQNGFSEAGIDLTSPHYEISRTEK